MGWKDFFKFKWSKLVLSIVIGGADLLLEYLSVCFGPQGLLACLHPVLKVLYVILNPFGLLIRVTGPYVNTFIEVIFLILQILFVYAISCLIVFLFGRIRQ